MKKFAFALILLATTAACTKKDPNLIPFNNGFQYRYSASEKNNIAAEHEGDFVTVEQLLSQSPALQDLARIENNLLLVMLYQHLLESLKAELLSGNKIEVNVYLADPGEKLEEDIKAAGLNLAPAISLNFRPPLVQLPTLAPTTIASIGDKAISIESLNLNHLRYQVIKRQQYQEMLSRLQGILVRRLLLKSAEAQQQTIEQFIGQNIVKETIKVSEGDVSEFTTKNNISSSELTPELTQKITAILSERKKSAEVEKYVSANILNKPITIFFNPNQAGFEIDPNMVTVWGFKSAPIHIALFSEMFCAQCVSLGQDLIRLREEFAGQLKISLNHFFADNDRNSRMLAEASMCAFGQNEKFFGQFYDAYVSQKLGPDEKQIYQVAQNIGADVEQLKTCFVQQNHKQLVQSHLAYAKSINVTSVPTLIIEDEIFEGRIAYDTLKAALEKQVQRKGDPWYRALYRRLFEK
jgi:predicted DsbA family dithiol-disulfide isomerase